MVEVGPDQFEDRTGRDDPLEVVDRRRARRGSLPNDRQEAGVALDEQPGDLSDVLGPRHRRDGPGHGAGFLGRRVVGGQQVAAGDDPAVDAVPADDDPIDRRLVEEPGELGDGGVDVAVHELGDDGV